VHEIVNHAHSILGSITLIQVIQPVARKPVTAEAVPDFTLPYLLTVLDSACDPGFWFDAVVASATGACLLLSCICATETTVHSAGSDQRGGNRFCFLRKLWIPVHGHPEGSIAMFFSAQRLVRQSWSDRLSPKTSHLLRVVLQAEIFDLFDAGRTIRTQHKADNLRESVVEFFAFLRVRIVNALGA